MNICLGGTFSPLHRGHRLLLHTAMTNLGTGTLYVGLTNDEFAMTGRSGEKLLDFKTRRDTIVAFLHKTGCRRYRIVEIGSANGIADRSAYLDGIVVSRETYPQALRLNEARRRNGLRGLSIFTVNLVKNRQGREIRARYIRRGEIDPEGRVQ
jgi:pantetheine-phosphate adenylyltransferase